MGGPYVAAYNGNMKIRAVVTPAYARGLGIDCGCFGVGEALSPTTLARDGALLGIAIALAVLATRQRSANS